MKTHSYIAIAAARSGGHIIPGMTLAHQHCNEHSNTDILFFSTDHAFDKKIIAEHTSHVHHIALSLDNVPGHWYQYPRFVTQCIGSLFKSFYHLARHRPCCVILMGGYISIPVCLAAWLLRIPRELYELNSTPGNATKLLAALATTIHVCFASAQHHFNINKTMISAYPLRFTKSPFSRTTAHTQLKLNESRTTILILGGSQGSLWLNNILLRCITDNTTLQPAINIIHQTGSQDATPWAQLYTNMDIPNIVFDYQNDLSAYYQAADIILGRAGAGTIFETLFFSKPCILIPLEITGNDHQLHNAQAIARQHSTLFTVIRQQEVKETTLPLFKALETKIKRDLNVQVDPLNQLFL